MVQSMAERKSYANDTNKRAAAAAGVLWPVKEKAKTRRQADGLASRPAITKAPEGGAKVETCFASFKRQFCYCKARYFRIAKNGAQVFSLVGARKPVSRSHDTLRSA